MSSKNLLFGTKYFVPNRKFSTGGSKVLKIVFPVMIAFYIIPPAVYFSSLAYDGWVSLLHDIKTFKK
jgi:hypothetical protein